METDTLERPSSRVKPGLMEEISAMTGANLSYMREAKISGVGNYELEEILLQSARAVVEGSAPLEVKRKIASALEARNKSREWNSEKSNVLIEEDPLRGATAILDGGAFYKVTWQLPGYDFVVRVKKSGKQDKFERARKMQLALAKFSQDGLLKPKIAHSTYSDPKIRLSAEPFIEHDRLVDLLRGKNDEEKAAILEPSIRDTLEIARVATAHRDYRDSDGNFVLKNNYSSWDIFRNFFPGNHIVTGQDSGSQFMKDFAFRNTPFLAERLLNGGKLAKFKMRKFPLAKELYQAFNEEFVPFYNQRRRHIVNKDNHTGNVLVDANGERTYCDFEHSYLDILEDPLSEMILTSGINDETVIKGMVDRTFDSFKGEINVSKDQFWQTLQRKLAEKTLTRAVRFADFAQRFTGGDRKQLEDQASAFYGLALRRLDKLGLKRTHSAVEAFNNEYLKLIPSNDHNPSLDRTLTSLVSNVDSPTLSDSMKFKQPLESKSVMAYAKKALITVGLLGALVMFGKNCHLEEKKPEISYLDSKVYSTRAIVNSAEGDKFREQSMVNTNLPSQEVVSKVFEIEDQKCLEEIIGKYKPKILPFALANEYAFELQKDTFAVDADMLRAICFTGSSVGNEAVIKKKEDNKALGEMMWPINHPFRYEESSGAGPSDWQRREVNIGAKILATASRYNQGNVAKTVASYVAGVSEMQKAMLKAVGDPNGPAYGDAQKAMRYGNFRKYLGDTDREVTDMVMVNYLAYKGAIPVVREAAPPPFWNGRKVLNLLGGLTMVGVGAYGSVKLKDKLKKGSKDRK